MTEPTRGPCSPWEPIFCAELPVTSMAASGTLLMAATQILYYKSAQLFDECTFTLRPCRDTCWGRFGWGSGMWANYGYAQWGGGPVPYLYRGLWYNLTCGSCPGSCSCVALQETTLPGPVREITEVKVDGVVLDPSQYRVDDFRKLVRVDGGVWPFCQNMVADDDQPDTWSVTAVIGEEVPELGKLAVGELTLDLMRSCVGAACAVPRGVTNITRQGVTVDLEQVSALLESGMLGLKFVDLFLNTYNPNRLAAPPQVFDVDAPQFRRTGTA